MKPLIVSASLGISSAVIVYPTAAGHVRLHNFDAPKPDHNLGRRRPTKTLIFAAMLALTAGFGVVVASHPAAARSEDGKCVCHSPVNCPCKSEPRF
jgi:hypothetical protein